MLMDIVLIPGALATPKFWHHQEAHWHGEKHIHYATGFLGQSIPDIAEQLIETLPKKFTLIGFSLGGYIALELMQRIPHQVDKLILINSAAKTLSEKGQIERERSIELINNGKFDFLINLIFKNSVHDKNKHHELLPLLKSMALEVGAKRYLEQLTAMVNKPDHSDLLTTIECPTLLIASKNDKVMPPERSEHMAENIKNSQLIYVENCGHMAPLEQPDRINQILSEWV